MRRNIWGLLSPDFCRRRVEKIDNRWAFSFVILLRRLIFQRQISHPVLNHKDRLLRCGADLVFNLCRHFGVEVIVLESRADQSFEMEPAADVIEIMTVFSSRLHGREHPSLYQSYVSADGRFREIVDRQNSDALDRASG